MGTKSIIDGVTVVQCQAAAFGVHDAGSDIHACPLPARIGTTLDLRLAAGLRDFDGDAAPLLICVTHYKVLANGRWVSRFEPIV